MSVTNVEGGLERAPRTTGTTVDPAGSTSIWANLLLIAFSTIVALVAAEGAIRFAAPQLIYRFPRDLFISDPIVSYRLRPGFRGELYTPEYHTDMRVNATGLRADREFGPKTPGVVRVLAIGDSFTMGVGVDRDRTLLAQVERLLTADGKQVEILNAGVSGYSTLQEARYLESYGFAYDPDLVLVGFFVGNDIAENTREPTVVKDGILADADEGSSGLLPTSLRRFLGLHSQLYHLVWPWQRRLFASGRAYERQETQSRLSPYLVDHAGNTASWKATFDALQSIIDTSRSHGTAVAVLLIPESMQSDDAQWGALLAAVEGRPADYARGEPNNRIAEFCAERNVPVHDLLPAFQAHNASSTLYFRQDHHWNDAGTVVAATSLHPFMRTLIDRHGPGGRRVPAAPEAAPRTP